MNYVVVDFEWNQAAYGRSSDRRRMPFEIIEIGAVLLNDRLEEIDRFSETIRPKVYRKLHHVTRDLTGISQEELNQSDPFPYVLMDFMYWCGDDDFIFCTWGNTDLVELQRNMKYHHLEDLLEGPIKYYNIQKMFRHLHLPDVTAASLETAVDFFGIDKHEGGFHRAVNDAAYTADVFRKMDLNKCRRLFSVDYYQNPKDADEEIHLTYDDYYKYISREFDSREKMIADKEVRSTRCYICGRPTRKKMHWFAGKAKNYYCIAQCSEHGLIRGKVRVKKTDEDRIFAVKTLRQIGEEDVEKIRSMKEEVLEKRRERRHKGSSNHSKEEMNPKMDSNMNNEQNSFDEE